MAADWLTHDLWRAHVSWITPIGVGQTEEGRKEFDAKRWIQQFQSAHYKTFIFYAKFHDGFCTFPSRFSKVKPERDFLGECVQEARRHGLRVLAYFSSVIDYTAGNEHPEWQVKNREGTPAIGWYSQQWPGSYCCINHPEYQDFVLGELGEIQDHYNPQGIWLDVYEPITQKNCFCPSCQAKYKESTGGGNLFDTDGYEWYRSCYVDFLRVMRMAVKNRNPDCVLGQNTGYRYPEYDPYDDFFTHEAFTGMTISLYCRAMRPLGKPFETTSRLYSEVHSWAMRGPNRVLLESLATVVHGGASCMELSPTPSGTIKAQALNRVAEAGQYIRDLEPYLLDTQPVYDAGVLQLPEGYGAQFRAPIPRWTSVLMERDIPFAFLYPDADLSPYPLIILDDQVPLDEKLAGKLKNYVENGGNLIVEGEAAAFGTAAGNLLSSVLGIAGKGKTGYPAHYLSDLAGPLAEEMGEDEMIVEGEAYQIETTTARVLGYFRHEFADRKTDPHRYMNFPPKKTRSNDPAITVNNFGKGRAMYIACPLTITELRNHMTCWVDTREYPTQLAENLARFMIPQPLLRGNTPAGVEVVVNAKEQMHIVHLLNHYATGPYIDNRRGLLKLADISVSINEQRIGSVKQAYRLSGKERIGLSLQRTTPWAGVRIPEMSIHEMIILEH